MNYSLSPLGDQAIVITVSDEINEDAQNKVRILSHLFDQEKPDWMVEYIPAFTTVTLFYNPLQLASDGVAPYSEVKKKVESLLSTVKAGEAESARTIEIPVCYGGEFGPDLEFVAEHNNLSTKEVIDIHSSGEYTVYMIGFAPGFPFIGGMSEKIAAPRRDSPRLAIPERTVGIAGMQTGVYPIETPGGWQLIGRTPMRLFTPEQETPSLLRAGDLITFKEISEEEYHNWEGPIDENN
ncbi:5-oxoprolinase subunit PxpB [Halobacillus shinanisalinarum]|uniref:5-oxoprolinase subunit PxpB n=1 Tax=Halobacillus shinanisalinarum TaxID=2932258 RepID=A0ABY4H380_9BACI|nr:5-oxoprolinase subunit PxpB [Halobacillus shinanisalinarum]UOQ94574.1 5-oxoprolinase subunit PxpB [Halobacillus shinanisalinarum]